MQLIRHWTEKVELEKEKCVNIGDQLVVSLKGFGEFIATAQTCTDEGTIFLFDDCVTERVMNKVNTNTKGFEASDLYFWMRDVLFPAFPEDLRPKIKELTIPTYGQIFGHDDWYERVMEIDGNEQWSLMKQSKNRISSFKGRWDRYWLKNVTKETSSLFACVYYNGNSYFCDASDPRMGVRPIFLLIH